MYGTALKGGGPRESRHRLGKKAGVTAAGKKQRIIPTCDRFAAAWMRSRNKNKFGRSVAQPGSALAWGARGPEFKSRRSDQHFRAPTKSSMDTLMDTPEKGRWCGRRLVVS
jgi:hypothetical protein